MLLHRARLGARDIALASTKVRRNTVGVESEKKPRPKTEARDVADRYDWSSPGVHDNSLSEDKDVAAPRRSKYHFGADD